MKKCIRYRVYASSLDPRDTQRVVTTKRSLAPRQFWTLHVRAVSITRAWFLAKQMTWTQKIDTMSTAGVVEARRVTDAGQLEVVDQQTK